ncbi:MAG: hypothetical protein OXC13_15900 [Caldilineaceae bacterium]|nr:hypothetical protein [Caldilineaceae bacterium]
MAHRDLEARLAWDNLARYKFANFGYWSSAWVRLNRLGGCNRPNPFRPAVQLARRLVDEQRAAARPGDCQEERG